MMVKNKRKQSSLHVNKDLEKRRKPSAASNLNEDVVLEIFTRIPGDILQNKLKYLCKQWFSIISSRNFINAHNARSAPCGFLQKAITKDGDIQLRFMDPKASDGNAIRVLDEFQQDFDFYPCNGLLLCESSESGDLWVTNPLTKETTELPDSGHGLRRIWIDLVFAPSTNTYKVVELLCNGAYVHKPFVIRIRTLGAEPRTSWRPIEGSDIKTMLIDAEFFARVAVDGVLYMNTGYSMLLVSLDIEDEKTIKLLPYPSYKNYDFTFIMEMGGFLSFVGSCYRGDVFFTYDVWTLKDADKKEWVHKFKINTRLAPCVKGITSLEILGSLSDGEVILFEGRDQVKVFAYYVKTKKWKNIKIPIGDEIQRIRPFFCRPCHSNFVSLKYLDCDLI